MKKPMKWLLAMALVAGCDGARPGHSGPGAGGTLDPTTVTAGERVWIDLRLRAEGAERFSSLLVAPGEVSVFADGAPVEVRPTQSLVDLANPEHADTVAAFALPPNAQRVEVRIGLGAAGSFEATGGGGWVDTRHGAIRFEAAGPLLLRTRGSVVSIDARRSFVARDGALVMVPSFRVN